MPKEESNQVAGLINFARNIGGSILIAITNAQVTSRIHVAPATSASRHAVRLARLHSHLNALQGFLGGAFGARQQRRHGAGLASTTSSTSRPPMQGYQDVYMELSWMSVGLGIARVPAQQQPSRPGPRPSGHALRPSAGVIRITPKAHFLLIHRRRSLHG